MRKENIYFVCVRLCTFVPVMITMMFIGLTTPYLVMKEIILWDRVNKGQSSFPNRFCSLPSTHTASCSPTEPHTRISGLTNFPRRWRALYVLTVVGDMITRTATRTRGTTWWGWGKSQCSHWNKYLHCVTLWGRHAQNICNKKTHCPQPGPDSVFNV